MGNGRPDPVGARGCAWIKKYGPDSVEHNAKADGQAQIRRLKKELKRATEERYPLIQPQMGNAT
jgi:hypothetical protein